ncbi:MAG: hypothetical protein JXA11_13975 [Phycisphaerae bacterium]|nr:hypothetical protein [Phycisphaerae bacterium]
MIQRYPGIVWGILLLVLAGCEDGKPTVVALRVEGVTPSTDVKHLSVVLKECVDKKGFIDVDTYKRVEPALRTQLRQMAITGPDATPALYSTDPDRLAYWYNARAGWSILLAMRLHGEKQESAGGLKGFLFPLNGRQMTMVQIDKAIFLLGGYQAVVAAPCANLHRAALPQTPFAAETIHEDVRRRFDGFVDDPRRFIIDVETRQIRFPAVLWQYREEILARHYKQYHAPQATFTTALLTLVHGSAARRLQDAVGYACVEDTTPGKLALTE